MTSSDQLTSGDQQMSGKQPKTLAEKLEFLRDRVRRPEDNRKYTQDQIADHLGRDRSYISALCSGKRVNPTQEVLEALADFFHVSPAFFFDDAKSQRITAQMDLAAALADGGTRELALRMLAEVHTDDVGLVVDMLQSIVKRRRKDPGEGSDGSG